MEKFRYGHFSPTAEEIKEAEAKGNVEQLQKKIEEANVRLRAKQTKQAQESLKEFVEKDQGESQDRRMAV